jgi:uroporphyrinogen-III synthase
MQLLVTRPLGEAERTAEVLRARGHDVLLAPLLRIEPCPDAEIGSGPWAAVLLTSGNAARAIAVHPKRQALLELPAVAVGRQTAAAAREAGFRDVVSADGDGADLARLVRARYAAAERPLLYLAGQDRARDLAAELAPHGIRVDSVTIYRALAAEALPDHVLEALKACRVDGVLHYSQRTAAIFVRCLRAQGFETELPRLTHYCLSARVAEPLRAAGATAIRIAAGPEEDLLLALLSS